MNGPPNEVLQHTAAAILVSRNPPSPRAAADRLGFSMSYCTVVELYQATDSCRKCEFSTFDELRAFLEAKYRGLIHQVSNLRVKYPEEWDEYDDECRDYGCSAVLQNQWRNRIQVGVSKDHWLIFKLDPFERVKLSTKTEGDHLIAFYLPEWTEYYVSELYSSDEGAQLVKGWLDNGVLG